jgi:hypothetical protein
MDRYLEIDDHLTNTQRWCHPGSNILLDFHGDPANADLVIFSDGNHHMALGEVLALFQMQMPKLKGVFYATTPPGPIVNLLKKGCLQLGNFVLSATPHIFIGPPQVLDRLVAEGYMERHHPFVRNQGNVLLVKRGNPKQITGVGDLRREGITLFLSNPETEKASYCSYRDTLVNLSTDAKIVNKLEIYYGSRIHHREGPEALMRGKADVAILFYHLALYLTRRFPDDFEMIPLGGSAEQPQPLHGNPIGHTHAGLIGEGGDFGRAWLEFLGSTDVRAIYRHHGLLPLTPN